MEHNGDFLELDPTDLLDDPEELWTSEEIAAEEEEDKRSARWSNRAKLEHDKPEITVKFAASTTADLGASRGLPGDEHPFGEQ